MDIHMTVEEKAERYDQMLVAFEKVRNFTCCSACAYSLLNLELGHTVYAYPETGLHKAAIKRLADYAEKTGRSDQVRTK